jgi:hypothetical protein
MVSCHYVMAYDTNRRAIWFEGKDGVVALLFEIITDKKLIVENVSDDEIAQYVDCYTNLCSGRESHHKAMIVDDGGGKKCLVSQAFKSCQQLPLPLTLTALAISTFGSSTNGFMHSSCLRKHQGTTSFLPSQPQKNLYCTVFLQKMDLKTSLGCFMKTTYSHAQSAILVRVN